MTNLKKINLNDPTGWQSLDWDDQEVHPELKRTDAQVNRARANKLKGESPNFKRAMSNAKTGKKRLDMVGDKNPGKTPEERKRRSELMKGVPKSKEQIENYKQAYKLLPMIVCPHCNFESKNQGNMNRYHMDNCKHK